MSTQCCRICYCLFENLFLWYAFCHAGTALGIVLPITLIIQAFANLVGLGGSPRAGIKLGEDNCKEANRIFNTAFFMLLVLGILIGMVTFLFSKQIVLLFGCPALIALHFPFRNCN